MATSKKRNLNKLDNIFEDISSSLTENEKKSHVPDIITFCNSKDWLWFPNSNIKLYPFQRIILKCFYRGSIGNEDLELTDSEIKLLEDLGMNDDDRGNVIDKYYSGELFREMVLVLGRRSGKDFLTSIIACYEVAKVLECEGGDPYAYYEISTANPIQVLTVANAKSQAAVAYNEIKSKIFSSPYFADKIIPRGVMESSIFLLTPKDKRDNKELERKRLPLKKGSVEIKVGHSNSDSQLGGGTMVLILDEVATYQNADEIFQGLTPSLATYVKQTYKTNKDGDYVLDEEGEKIVTHRRYDGKMIAISSPRDASGKLYDLFTEAPKEPRRISFRFATWEFNPRHTRKSLREIHSSLSDIEFEMEYGAEFAGTGDQSFLSRDQVESCFSNHNHILKPRGVPGRLYFAHIDPASSSHNYALVIAHKELIKVKGKIDYNIVIDHIQYWQPTDTPINRKNVINYIIRIKSKFPIVLLTYDQWADIESLKLLQEESIPHKLLRYNRPNKVQIYSELENTINEGKLKIPFHNLLKQEMIGLKRKYDGTSGFKVYPSRSTSSVGSDDIIDAVAGVTFSIKQYSEATSVSSKVISCPMGTSDMSNGIPWRNMDGSIKGIGNGKQVYDNLNKQTNGIYGLLR